MHKRPTPAAGLLVLAALALLAAGFGVPGERGRGGHGGAAAGGRLDVEPATFDVGQHGDVLFTYTAGAEGLPAGGVFLLQLPGPLLTDVARGIDRGWWSRVRLGCAPDAGPTCVVETPDPPCESDTPEVGCTTAWVDSAGGARVVLAHERSATVLPHFLFRNYVRATVDGEPLAAGDRIVLRFHGRVQTAAGEYRLRATEVALGRRDPLLDVTPLTFRSGPAQSLHATLPSRLAPEEPFELAVVALDAYGNAATDYAGVVDVLCDGGPCTGVVEGLPRTFAFAPGADGDAGVHVLAGARFVTATEAFHRVELVDATAGLRAWSNYTRVRPGGWQERIYFGDTHFHTGAGANGDVGLGGDHRGQYTAAWVEPEQTSYPFQGALQYARDVSRLDFAVLSEHDQVGQVTPELWEQILVQGGRAEVPGRFVVFPGYEWTSREWGHRVVLYREVPDPGCCRVYAHWEPDASQPADLWQRLAEAEACGCASLVVPHVMNANLGKNLWHQEPTAGAACPTSPTEMRADDRQVLAEMYSQHNLIPDDPDGDGTADLIDDPCLYEMGGPEPEGELGTRCDRLGREGAESLRCAWRLGHRLGTIGSSDNHTARPGMNDDGRQFAQPGGLAAVHATDLTRGGLWDGMQGRRAYATSGTRIYLDFVAQRTGVPGATTMGGALQLDGCAPEPITLRGMIAGTDTLRAVEILRYDGTRDEWTALVPSPPLEPDADTVYELRADDQVDGEALVYLRVRQSDGEIAWSSPIWIEREPGACP